MRRRNAPSVRFRLSRPTIVSPSNCSRSRHRVLRKSRSPGRCSPGYAIRSNNSRRSRDLRDNGFLEVQESCNRSPGGRSSIRITVGRKVAARGLRNFRKYTVKTPRARARAHVPSPFFAPSRFSLSGRGRDAEKSKRKLQ